MSSDRSTHVGEALGAYVLGDVSPNEAARILAHLDACATCRDEAESLRAVGAALRLADGDHLDERFRPSETLEARIMQRARDEARGVRMRRLRATLAAAVAAAAVAAGVTAVVMSREPGLVVADRDPALPESIAVLDFVLRPAGTSITGALVEGTQTHIILDVKGFQAGRYLVWMEQTEGRKHPCGVFEIATAGGDATQVDVSHVDLTYSGPRHEALAVVIDDEQGRLVARAPIDYDHGAGSSPADAHYRS